MTRFLFLVAGALTALSAQAQKAELTFGVSGICGMCENRIEAAFDQKGIVAADYNLDTKKIHVVYKATEEAYANMHGCCKYRDPKSSSDSCGDKQR